MELQERQRDNNDASEEEIKEEDVQKIRLIRDRYGMWIVDDGNEKRRRMTPPNVESFIQKLETVTPVQQDWVYEPKEKIKENRIECRTSSSTVASPVVDHLSNSIPVRRFYWKDFTLEMYEEIVVKNREPVILERANEDLKGSIWTFEHLKKKHPQEQVSIRYMKMNTKDESQFATIEDSDKDLEWFVENADEADCNLSKTEIREGWKVMMYAKDFSFSESIEEWLKDLRKRIPQYLVPQGPHDLMGNLPQKARPIVWMGYLGADGTRTALHVDKIASIAFNLHVIGDGIKHWWLIDHTELSNLEKQVSNFGGNFWRDNFWMAPAELEKLNLKMWHCQQKRGDLVIVPPMVPHTVINTGSLSCAVAANILHVDAIRESWEREKVNRTIRRASLYRLKMTVWYSLDKAVKDQDLKMIKKLSPIFKEILQDEHPESIATLVKCPEWFACDGCGADIFNRRYQCDECAQAVKKRDSKSRTYDLCPPCFTAHAKARKFHHPHKLTLVERIPLRMFQNTLDRGMGMLKQAPS
eukprot:TRINITY_DN2920_c0_g1_i1.p1 TRINITY_DN2920_c0_g1~~TRINITY_DN2920_c0_g1_i1.p1  ORF type:complete len:537 (-),score=137.67 TRINITY_DN2920_c0_g1_i1:27-1607(-)